MRPVVSMPDLQAAENAKAKARRANKFESKDRDYCSVRYRSVSNLRSSIPQKEGWLLKQGFRWRKRWCVRWVVLQDQELQYYESDADVDKNSPLSKSLFSICTPSKLRGSVILNEDSLILDSPSTSETAFCVIPRPGGLSWNLEASSVVEKEEWIEQLIQAAHGLPGERARTFNTAYKLGKEIGRGSHAIVREVISLETKERLAVKIIAKSRLASSSLGRRHARNEISIMRWLSKNSHPHIVNFREIFEDPLFVYVIMDQCTGGELFDQIVKHHTLSEEVARRIIFQLASALNHLHENNIVHRDLKPENLLFTDHSNDSAIKVIDFGMATKLPSHSIVMNEVCGTVGYVAPEVIMHRIYEPPCDVFSLGVILYIILVGSAPFAGNSSQAILHRTIQGSYNTECRAWKRLSPEAQDLISRMLEIRPRNRITARDILRHPWILTKASEKCDLHVVRSIQQFNAKRKLRGAVIAVMMSNVLISSLGDQGMRRIVSAPAELNTLGSLDQVCKSIIPLTDMHPHRTTHCVSLSTRIADSDNRSSKSGSKTPSKKHALSTASTSKTNRTGVSVTEGSDDEGQHHSSNSNSVSSTASNSKCRTSNCGDILSSSLSTNTIDSVSSANHST